MNLLAILFVLATAATRTIASDEASTSTPFVTQTTTMNLLAILFVLATAATRTIANVIEDWASWNEVFDGEDDANAGVGEGKNLRHRGRRLGTHSGTHKRTVYDHKTGHSSVCTQCDRYSMCQSSGAKSAAVSNHENYVRNKYNKFKVSCQVTDVDIISLTRGQFTIIKLGTPTSVPNAIGTACAKALVRKAQLSLTMRITCGTSTTSSRFRARLPMSTLSPLSVGQRGVLAAFLGATAAAVVRLGALTTSSAPTSS
eukprot:CAMPEP_0178585934 /NCGR_PEP_ID=MMETSP0697-20121206/25655_1 /TAXON_ID=265572 /ORGANISM="Extubocellulus spinifer, Strain CCMP396" /LENGTH=256 /DNA_ID=CAMNT_0020222031 /DNA_START=409 /DNA_END=1179 /DNA_ORIENTATION=+